MALNSNPINARAINVSAINAVPPIARGKGTLISIEQKVGVSGSGSLISIEQIVRLRLSSTVSESLISIEQIVRNTGSGSLISIEQVVRDIVTTPVTHLSRMGWDMFLRIGGQAIPRNQIVGNTDISRTAGDASLMTITLLPPIGVQNIESYHGKSITLDIQTATGYRRAYTGSVDIPDVDLINETVTLLCTDKRTERLNAQPEVIVNTIGVYSDKIFNEPKDTAELIEQRLTTTPHDIDFDAFGNYTITPWLPKAVADITLTDSDVYRNKPRVEFTSRGRVTNTVNIALGYRYERNHHTTRGFGWQSPIAGDACLLVGSGYSLTSRANIISAISGAGWPVVGNISFSAIPSGGWYRCGGTLIGWMPTLASGETTAKTDENGNVITDPDGNILTETRINGGTDFGALFAAGATWQASTRWTQTVTESHTLTLTAPQSVNQFGTIAQNLTYGVSDELQSNTENWEDFIAFSSSGLGNNYNIDQDNDRDGVNSAIDVALRQGKNVILGSHRDTRVFVDTFIKPEIDLRHTILVSTDEVVAKGKVFEINHRLNHSTGEATTTTTLVLSRISGSASDSALTIPGKIADNVSYNTSQIELGNHFGQDPTQSGAELWNGFVGNKTLPGTFFRTNYTEQFIVDTPKIEDNLRESKELAATTAYTVAIPNDTLTITFDGKS